MSCSATLTSHQRRVFRQLLIKESQILEKCNNNISQFSKMLNECLTPMGKRKFLYNFLNPTTNITYLQREYNITEHLIEDCEKKSTIWRKHMYDIKDIEKLYRQIIHKKITPRKLYYIYKNLEVIIKIYEIKGS